MSNSKKQTILSNYLDEVTRAHLGQLYHYSNLPSTNEWLQQYGQCGDICLADQQSAGRGRNGRGWQSPDGNIYLSLCWCFAEVSEYYSWLSLMVGVAVSRALEQCGLQEHGLKWPNDIYYDNKKLAGLLLQSSGQLKKVVIGVGVNMQLDQRNRNLIDKPCCALSDYLPEIERLSVVAALLQQLVQTLLHFPNESRLSFQQQWQRWDLLLGKAIHVDDGKQQLPGVVQGLTEQGYLQVLHDNGQLQAYSAADISVRL